MAVVALADVADVEAVLGRPLTADEAARVQPILDKASELFRLESGQQFTPGTSENRLRVRGATDVFLPQRPVDSVESVTDDHGEPLTFTFREQIVRLEHRSHLTFVLVAYTHGGAVPDVIRLAVAEIGAVVLRIDQQAMSGASQFQETVGPFTRQASYAPWAIGGATRLSPDDIQLARSFRNPWRALVTLGS